MKKVIALIIACLMINCVNIYAIDFVDEDLESYSLEELENLITQCQETQKTAHALAEAARALGWPEDCEAIQTAQAEWYEARMALQVYQTQYEHLLLAEKYEEYPSATYIWSYMKNLGWSDYVCAGILGNIMAEVGGNTLYIQYWLYGSSYYGICQWNKAYRNSIWGADLASQCDFLRDTIEYELDTFGYAYCKGFDFEQFLLLEDEQDAAEAFRACYERCSTASKAIRQKNATLAYDYFVNN